jgi:hypothetical protein
MFKVVLVLCAFVFSAWSQTSPQLKLSTLETGYVPNGFDSNDQVQIVVEGTYRDTCSKPAGTRFTVNANAKTIQIQPYEYRYASACLDVMVPHNEVVNLGIVQPGRYQVIQASGQRLGFLNVNLAVSSAADDYLYAPISQAYIKNVNGRVALTLSGVYTNSCMKIKKIIANVQDNVVTVQPVAMLLPTAANCIHGRFPFEETTNIQIPRSGRYLLHVRSLNGESINTLFDL